MINFDYVYGDNCEDKYENVELSIERITPEVAEKMLKANVGNRSIKRSSISKAITEDEYMLNGATIVFDDNGVLLDGQHRLLAVVKSGQAIDSVVIRGISKAAQITMDVGSRRCLSDYLKMDGYKEATRVAAVGTAMMFTDRLGFDVHFSNSRYRDSVTLKELYEYTTSVYESRIEPIMRNTSAIGSQFKLRVGLLGPLFDAFYRVSSEDFDAFAEQIRGFKSQCQPVQKLVRVLGDNAEAGKKSTLSTKTIAAYVIKTWNAYMQGVEIPFLRFVQGGAHPETFPSIYGMNGEL